MIQQSVKSNWNVLDVCTIKIVLDKLLQKKTQGILQGILYLIRDQGVVHKLRWQDFVFFLSTYPPLFKVILLRGEATETGREGRSSDELRLLRSWKKSKQQ